MLTNTTCNDINIEAVEQYICRVQSLTALLRKSQDRAREQACLPYFGIFGTDAEMHQVVERQNAVTSRIAGYLLATIRKELGNVGGNGI